MNVLIAIMMQLLIHGSSFSTSDHINVNRSTMHAIIIHLFIEWLTIGLIISDAKMYSPTLYLEHIQYGAHNTIKFSTMQTMKRCKVNRQEIVNTLQIAF